MLEQWITGAVVIGTLVFALGAGLAIAVLMIALGDLVHAFPRVIANWRAARRARRG